MHDRALRIILLPSLRLGLGIQRFEGAGFWQVLLGSSFWGFGFEGSGATINVGAGFRRGEGFGLKAFHSAGHWGNLYRYGFFRVLQSSLVASRESRSPGDCHLLGHGFHKFRIGP